MSKKKSNNTGGLVYSTDPNFIITGSAGPEEETINPSLQKLRVRMDNRHRAGKAVTMIEGFTGKEADREELGRKLKTFCGTGGSVKGCEIIIQGDNRDKILQWLLANGYTASKRI